MSQIITDIRIQTFANAAVIRSNIAMIDNLSPRYGANIGLTGNLIPTIDGTFNLGDGTFRFKEAHSNDVYANTFHPENNQTITFFGNLFPNIDNVYYLGFPQQRWRHLYVDDVTVSGNAAFTGPSTLIDAFTNIIDDVDATKKFQFQASGISSGQTRIYTVQDVNDTFVYRNTTDTLINKTLTDNTNNILARGLWNGTGTGSVSTYAAAAPITGQVLTATNATTATWQTPSSAPTTFVDTTFAVYDVTDNTKAIKLDASGTTGTSTTLLSSQTTNKVLTLPDVTDTLITRSTTDTLTNKTLTDNTNNILARGLWNGSGTGSVSTYAAAAPTVGQRLVATSATTATWQTDPTTFVDATFAIYDVTDQTKNIKFDAAGTTGTSTTLLSSQTTNKVLTLPDATDTLIARGTTDTLLNKTLTDNTNNVISRQLWVGSGTGSVSTYAAAAPVTGQILVATTPSTATWQTLSSITPTTFVDTTFAVYDVTDNTKAIKLDAAGTTGTSTTLLSSQTTNKVLTLPDATDTLVARATTDTLLNKTLTDNTNNIISRQLWVGSGTGSVSTYTAAAPVTGQILVATTPSTATWQTLSSITPTTFVDTTFAVYDVTNNTISIKLDAAGTTGTSTTLLSSQTTNKALTLPDATDTLVARNTTDTLTNKTLTDNTNNVISRQLWVGSGTGSVSTYTAAAPAIGQRLVATSATTANWQFDGTTFVDTTFAIYDVTDQTKNIRFDAAGTTGTSTTLLSSQTTNKVLTLPDATDTLVARATTDTLLNKTLTDNTNNILARGLWNGTGTGSVSTYTAAAPVTGQILVATTPSTATWQTLSSITPTTFVDTTFTVYDVTDNTKSIKLDAAGTTGTNTTLLSSQTTNKVLTLPDATDTLVARSTTDTLLNKTLTDNTNNILARGLWNGSGTGSVSTYLAAAPTVGQRLVATSATTATWQTDPVTFVDTTFAIYDVTDQTKAIKFDAAGTTGTSTTLLSSQTTNKVLTLPDATDTLIARATTDTLTNKTLTDNTNNVISRQLWVGSGTGSVSTYAAAAPVTGQILVATTPSTATWQTLSSITPTTFVDTTFAVYDVTDNTKAIKLDAAGTTGTSTTLLSSQTTNKVLTLPDATDTLIARATTDTLLNKTLTENTNNILARGLWNGTGTGSVSTYVAAAPVTGQILVATTPSTATWQTLSSITPTTFVDATFTVYDVTNNTISIKFDAAGTTGTSTTLLSSQTTNKVLTLPDATDTLVARSTTDTLLNKTLTDNTNNILARGLWNGSGTGSVSTYVASAPTVGQRLVATSATTANWQTDPVTFVDTTFAVYDVTDNTKSIKLDAAGTTGTSTTLLSSQTTNKVLTLPDATDTIVARATTDILTNKTLTDNTNNVISRQLWVGSGTGSVSTYTAAAPVTGQILVATTPSTATWQTLSSITPTTFVDTTFSVYDVTDNTKSIKLDAAGTTGTSTTLLSSQTTNKILTLPDVTDTLVARTTTDTLLSKTLTDNTNNILARGLWNGSGTGSVSTYVASAPVTGQILVATTPSTATWQTLSSITPTTFVDTTFAVYDVTDNTKNIKFDAAGTTGTSTTLLSSQTSNKILTLPDATDTLVARATTDTLLNKTLTDNTNNVLSRGLWNGSGTGSVSTYVAAAPTIGQRLAATSATTATWQTDPVTFVDSTFAIYDVTDQTKNIKFDAAGTTGTSTTLLSSQTTNKVLTLPDATDTLVARNTTDTLTNKTLTDNTNNILARGLWNGTGTGSVSTYVAAAPVTGQILVATTPTTATWQTLSSITPTTFVDTTFSVYDITDNTKSIKLDAAGTTGTSTTLLSSQTTNKVLTLPDATDTLVARTTTDTLTNKTLTDNTNNILARGLWNGSGTGSVSTYVAAAPSVGQRLVATSATTANWQTDPVTFVDTTFAIYDVTDQTKSIKFDAAGTTGTSTSLLSSQTTNKVLTLPDATDTLVARNTTDTLLNKTLTDNTNNIISRQLWVGSGTGSVSTYTAAAPVTGQILVATTPSTATWQTLSSITPTTFVDTTFSVYDVTDNTKAIKLDAAGTTGTSTTLLSSQTTNKVLTLPDATDTLVARNTTDTLTNKTLTDNTNNILARGLWNGTGTGSVSTYVAAAPVTGQILVATTPTTATWQTLSSISPTTFVDTTFAVYDVTDNTKSIKLDAAGTTGTSTTLLSSQTTNKVLTLPDATDTLVARATIDTLLNKTLTDNTNNIISRQLWVGSGTGSVSTYAAAAPVTGQILVATTPSTATWQTLSSITPTTFVDTTFAVYDVTNNTISIKLDAAGTTGTSTTLLSSQTTNKVLTLPDATDTLVARATTDTLLNKTLTDNTNNILARGLWNGTGTGSVSTYVAAAPTIGQRLVATSATTANWQTDPVTFVDTTFAIYDVTDQTKNIKFDAAGTTGTSTTLLSSQTTNKVLTLPDATDTLVARSTTDTLTNKTLTDNTNNILARGLWNGTGTGSVSTYTAAAPVTGQILVATTPSTATWQTLSSITPTTFVDTTFAVYDVTDNTKSIKLDAAGTTGTSTTLLGSQTTNKVLTLPDATDTLVARATTDTLLNKTLTDNTNNILARGLWNGTGTGSVSTYVAAAPVTGQILVATTPTTATWQTLSSITPTTFVDTTFAVYDVTNNTISIRLDAAGTTGTSTTLLSSQTTNKVLTLPDATDTLVARTTTDTLLNKTLTDNTNNVISRQMWVGSGTGSVSTYTAAAPVTGQILVATTPSTATWQTLSSITPTTFVDTTFAVYDVTNNTISIRLDAAGTTGTSTTLLSSQTTNKVLTLPDATDTLVARATTDTLTNKTLTDNTNNVLARGLWNGTGTGSVSTYAAAAPTVGQRLVATSATTANWQTDPVTFVDTTFAIYDITDQTKSIKFDAAGTTGTSTTLLSSQTTNKTLTLPDATDTLVARATTDTLTNKTLTDNTNNVISRQLWVGSGTGSVSTYAAAAPVTGQILVATTPSTATWQTLSSITPTTFVDTTFAVYDVTNNTISIRLDAAGTTGTSTTLLSSQTTNKSLTLPDATDTLVARATTDTLTNKTLTDNTNNVLARGLWNGSGTGSVSTYVAAAPTVGQRLVATSATTANWQTDPVTFVDTTFAIYDITDQTKSIKFDAAGTTGTSTTLLSSQTTNKTLTLPDATDTLVARATTDTLTNKTLTDNTNNVISRQLWVGSGTGSVSTYTAAFPTTGQVLTATNATTATWQTPSASTSLTYSETTATTTTSTTSTTYTQINSMTVTPAAGTWLVMFSSSGSGDSTSRDYNYAIHKANVIIQHSERNLNFGGGSQTNNFDSALHTQAIVTVNGSEIIDVKYKGTSGTFTVYGRSMELIRVA